MSRLDNKIFNMIKHFNRKNTNKNREIKQKRPPINDYERFKQWTHKTIGDIIKVRQLGADGEYTVCTGLFTGYHIRHGETFFYIGIYVYSKHSLLDMEFFDLRDKTWKKFNFDE